MPLFLLFLLIAFFCGAQTLRHHYSPVKVVRSRTTFLSGEMRLLIHGTKNAFTTVRKNDLVLFRLEREIGNCHQGLGLFDGKDILPLCVKEDDPSLFLIDISRPSMNGEELKSSGRLLRIVSSDRSGLGFKVDEYLDETVYIPIKDSMPIVPKSNTLAVDGVGDFDVQRVRSMLLGALSELDKLPETAIKFSITSPRVMKSEKYSHAIVAGGMVYTSGIIATNIEFGGLIEGDVRKQTIQALENLKEILLSAGSNMKCVCRMTVILRDIQDLEIVNAVYSEYFPKNSDQPARVCFASSGIPMNALIEVEAIAVLPAMNRKIRTEE